MRIGTAVAIPIAAMLALAIALAGGAAPRGDRFAGQAESAASQPPRLVVFLIVDQIRRQSSSTPRKLLACLLIHRAVCS